MIDSKGGGLICMLQVPVMERADCSDIDHIGIFCSERFACRLCFYIFTIQKSHKHHYWK